MQIICVYFDSFSEHLCFKIFLGRTSLHSHATHAYCASHNGMYYSRSPSFPYALLPKDNTVYLAPSSLLYFILTFLTKILNKILVGLVGIFPLIQLLTDQVSIMPCFPSAHACIKTLPYHCFGYFDTRTHPLLTQSVILQGLKKLS